MVIAKAASAPAKQCKGGTSADLLRWLIPQSPAKKAKLALDKSNPKAPWPATCLEVILVLQ